LAEVPVPAGVVTANFPVVAPAGIVALIWVALLTVKAADVPFSASEVAPVKFVPVMVTELPV
jgi:hypothetical protein